MICPAISVIVPAYNAVKTLSRCLDSLLSQTFSDFEIILIDDGSTDGSESLYIEYAQRDKRVIPIILKENKGVSNARQLGMDTAQGKYITFLDADDWVNDDMLEKLFACSESNNADIVFADYFKDTSSWTKTYTQDPGNKRLGQEILPDLFLGELKGFCCTKLYRKSACEGLKFYPSDISFREDELFNARFLARNPVAAYVPEAFYHYWVENTHSLSHASIRKIYPTLRYLIGQYHLIAEECNLDKSCLYRRELEILEDAFVLKKFRDLHLFPETKERYLSEKHPYVWKQSRPFFLTLALKGFPWIASPLYIINARIADLFQ